MDTANVKEVAECSLERCNAYLKSGWSLLGLFQKTQRNTSGENSYPVYVLGWSQAGEAVQPFPATRTSEELRRDARM